LRRKKQNALDIRLDANFGSSKKELSDKMRVMKRKLFRTKKQSL
jgi:hypothetical protein